MKQVQHSHPRIKIVPNWAGSSKILTFSIKSFQRRSSLFCILQEVKLRACKRALRRASLSITLSWIFGRSVTVSQSCNDQAGMLAVSGCIWLYNSVFSFILFYRSSLLTQAHTIWILSEHGMNTRRHIKSVCFAHATGRTHV